MLSKNDPFKIHPAKSSKMSSHGSVSQLIDDVRKGSDAAGRELWDRYQPKLLKLARARLGTNSTAVADEEDIVVMAFRSFLCRTSTGGFPELKNRDELWRLLVTITARKSLQHIRTQNSTKRRPDTHDGSAPFLPLIPGQFAADTPAPEFAAMMNDTFIHLLGILNDGELREIVIKKLEGFTNLEIAQQIDRSESTVERRLHLIREKWKHEFEI